MTRPTLRNAALTCATRWQWPVLPGTMLRQPEHPSDRRTASLERAVSLAVDGPDGLAGGDASCSCADPECVVPGAHPQDPVLLAATTDARMVGWWWSRRPDASLLLATGAAAAAGRSPCALSLPAVAGAHALAECDRLGVRLGPVVATPTRFALLVEPYELEELGDLLYTCDQVPSALRFHGDGGYVALPPTPAVTGRVRWERRPVVEGGRRRTAPWLPRMESVLRTLVEASVAAPDTGSRLAY